MAEQLGRLVGTARAKADGLVDRATLRDQLTRIRDGATGLLGALGGGTSLKPKRQKAQRQPTAKAPSRAAAQGRSGGKVDAPGKKHRKPAARGHSVKHSNETISKSNAARRMRRGPNKD